jgi:hypothetical protein
MTLVLDNFEHVVAAAPVVPELLARCPQLRAAVTSRTRLRLSVERLYQVTPLAVPSESELNDSLMEFGSVRRFIDRASEAEGLTQIDWRQGSLGGSGDVPPPRWASARDRARSGARTAFLHPGAAGQARSRGRFCPAVGRRTGPTMGDCGGFDDRMAQQGVEREWESFRLTLLAVVGHSPSHPAEVDSNTHNRNRRGSRSD